MRLCESWQLRRISSTNWIIRIYSLPGQSRCYDNYRSKRRWTFTVQLFMQKLKEKKCCIWENWARFYRFSHLSSLHCQCQYDQLSHQEWEFSLLNNESLEEQILHVDKNVSKRCSWLLHCFQMIFKRQRSCVVMWQMTENLWWFQKNRNHEN